MLWLSWQVLSSHPSTGSRRKEGNVLFNDALNTFYIRLYGVEHIVKELSDRERGNPLPPLHGLLFSISSKFFYMHHPTDRIAHTTAFVTPVVDTGSNAERVILHGGPIEIFLFPASAQLV